MLESDTLRRVLNRLAFVTVGVLVLAVGGLVALARRIRSNG